MRVLPMTTSNPLRPLTVTHKQAIARDIWLFELRDPAGAMLPAVEAGAHLPLRVPSGAMRQYSLCGDPQDRSAYRLAVKREAGGRGGSISLVDGVQQGDTVMTGEPANLFALSEKARKFILVAGGIGITPMMAMVQQLQAEGMRSFQLVYLTRDPEGTAFLSALQAPELAGQVRIHHDHGDPARSLDLWPLFEKVASGTHVYCCGPKALMDSVRDMTGHWPESAIHFESFGADTRAHADDQPFVVELARSHRRVEVGAKQSILEALRAHDIHVPSSCESGTCGSCKVGLLRGEADHRDMVLMAHERAQQVMVCVSRCKGADPLVLDL